MRKDSGIEAVTEYLATNWTGDKSDTGYEVQSAPKAFPMLEDAVIKMGNGDRNKGLDLLKRAYFGGDLRALEMLKKYFPPDEPVK